MPPKEDDVGMGIECKERLQGLRMEIYWGKKVICQKVAIEVLVVSMWYLGILSS